jgi:prevent-host-death family protein
LLRMSGLRECRDVRNADEISSSEFSSHPASVVDRVRYERVRVVLTRNGKRCAALVPLEDLDDLQRRDAANSDGAETKE